MNPPVSSWILLSTRRWPTQWRGLSTWPYIIVLVVGMPTWCAVVTTSTQVRVGSLPLVRIQRTSSSRISAAVPGSEPRPASRALIRKSSIDRPVRAVPLTTSIGLNAWTCISGTRCLDRGDQVEVRRRGQLGVDAALHADLGRAEVPGLLGAVGDLVEGQRVGVGVGAPLGERAEPAADVADVGEVDVAVDDVGHLVADGLPAQVVGQPDHLLEQRPLGGHQGQGVLVGQVAGVLLRGGHARLPRQSATFGRADGRPDRSSRTIRRRLSDRVPVAVDVGEVGAAVVGAALGVDRGEQVGAARRRRTRRRAPATAARWGVRRASPGRRRVASAATWAETRGSSHGSPARTYSGCTVSRAASSKPHSAVIARSRSSEGQGRSGLTWSGVSGETPPQSSTPASSRARHSDRSTRLGGAWTRAFGPRTRRVTAIAARYSSRSRSSACRIAVSGLARKFWTITSCTAP